MPNIFDLCEKNNQTINDIKEEEQEIRDAIAEDQHDETRKPANLTWNKKTGKYESNGK